MWRESGLSQLLLLAVYVDQWVLSSTRRAIRLGRRQGLGPPRSIGEGNSKLLDVDLLRSFVIEMQVAAKLKVRSVAALARLSKEAGVFTPEPPSPRAVRDGQEPLQGESRSTGVWALRPRGQAADEGCVAP